MCLYTDSNLILYHHFFLLTQMTGLNRPRYRYDFAPPAALRDFQDYDFHIAQCLTRF